MISSDHLKITLLRLLRLKIKITKVSSLIRSVVGCMYLMATALCGCVQTTATF